MRYSFLFFFLLLLQSCATSNHLGNDGDRLQQLDQYLADQEFTQALSFIADTPKDDKQALELEEKRKVVLDQLRAYEKQTINTALKQEKNDDWTDARQTYLEALKKNRTSNPLIDAQGAMVKRFRVKMETLDHEVLILTGEFLQKKLPLLQEYLASDPDNTRVKWNYSRSLNDARETAVELLRVGEQMLAEKNFAMADRTIPLAVKLAPDDPESQSAFHLLNRRTKAQKKKKQKGRQKVAKKNDKREIDAFNEAMAQGKLSRARFHLDRLTSATRRSMAAKLMEERLDDAIAEYVQNEQSIGDSFYRVGDYQQAIKVWENIIELDSKNEVVKNKLDRAAAIVDKLKSLRKRQKQE